MKTFFVEIYNYSKPLIIESYYRFKKTVFSFWAFFFEAKFSTKLLMLFFMLNLVIPSIFLFKVFYYFFKNILFLSLFILNMVFKHFIKSKFEFFNKYYIKLEWLLFVICDISEHLYWFFRRFFAELLFGDLDIQWFLLKVLEAVLTWLIQRTSLVIRKTLIYYKHISEKIYRDYEYYYNRRYRIIYKFYYYKWIVDVKIFIIRKYVSRICLIIFMWFYRLFVRFYRLLIRLSWLIVKLYAFFVGLIRYFLKWCNILRVKLCICYRTRGKIYYYIYNFPLIRLIRYLYHLFIYCLWHLYKFTMYLLWLIYETLRCHVLIKWFVLVKFFRSYRLLFKRDFRIRIRRWFKYYFIFSFLFLKRYLFYFKYLFISFCYIVINSPSRFLKFIKKKFKFIRSHKKL